MGLRRALARVHRSAAGAIQARRERTSHFWQGRFGAVAMDERHVAVALRYVSLNPVRARLVQRGSRRWASTRAHLRERDDGLADDRGARNKSEFFSIFSLAYIRLSTHAHGYAIESCWEDELTY